MEEWKTYKLEDLCKRICSGGTPKSTCEEFYGGTIPWLNTKEVNFNRIYETESTITQTGYNNSSAKWVDANSIIVAMYGNTAGKVALAKIPLTTNQACCNLTIDELKADYRYLFYYLLSQYDIIKSKANGAAQQNLNAQQIKDLLIPLPSLETQRVISDILTALDDKIELNNRINHNLEEQAQALYKSWCVDFEPFKDGKFVESELGMIPEGWRVGRYNDIISTTVSGDWGKEDLTGNYTHKVSCIRGCDFADASHGLRGNIPERYILEKNYDNKRLLDKDIIVEISGGTPTVSTGRICMISNKLLKKYNNDLVCTNFCKIIRPHKGYSSYIFYSWFDKYLQKVMFGYENGTSGIKNFQLSDFLEKEPVIIPSLDAISRFATIIDSYQIVIQMNGSENTKYTEIRDTLLPKLMSGELKINEIDC